MLIKLARIVKRKGKWCVIGHKKGKGGKHKVFGCYNSKEKAKKRLGQIYFFKSHGALDRLLEAADEMDSRGMLHLADAVEACVETVVSMGLDDGNPASVRIGKIVSLLEKRGEHDLAEKVDAAVPDIIDVESGRECGECPDMEVFAMSRRIGGSFVRTADRMYKTAIELRRIWNEGAVGDDSFEHRKMRELRCVLKTGFLAPPPPGCKVPKGFVSWWDYFNKAGDKE